MSKRNKKLKLLINGKFIININKEKNKCRKIYLKVQTNNNNKNLLCK